MKRSFVKLGSALLGLLYLVAAWADGPVTPRFPNARISVEQWSAFFAQVKAVPDVRCEDAPLNQYICDSSAQRTIWVFTREGHPAHPAATRGVMLFHPNETGVSVGIDRYGYYAGDQAAFEAWMKEFRLLDERQVAQWRSMLEKPPTPD